MKIIKKLKKNKKIMNRIIIPILIFIFLSSLINLIIIDYQFSTHKEQNLNSSGTWATLDLTNPVGINNSRFTHDTLISVQGRLFNKIFNTGKPGFTVAIEVNDIIYPKFNGTTDPNGDFQINYIIDHSLDIYSSHKIEATVIDSTPDSVEYRTHYIIYVSMSSFFDCNETSTPKLIGEYFDSNGYLRYYNNTGIPLASINYYWYDGPVIIDNNFTFTDDLGLIQNIPIPDFGSDDLDLKLTFESPPEIGYSEIFLYDTKIFNNISCIWDVPTTIKALSNLTISGQVVSNKDPNLILKERPIEIYYNDTFLVALQTDLNGEFSYTHLLSAWNGSSLITLRLVNILGKNVITTFHITIEALPLPITPTPGVPPFLVFFSVFIPILAVVIGGLAFYGYRYYKKQDKLSKVVDLPLESKIINLKILKDTGRLEESLSYLFNAIYMDLINAKFGRTRSDNETIRDFAIISVKNLKLSPTTIYPFIQKVEEIIYAKPFQITDKEFYNTINLFSPIYFELTGYNFVLNF